MRKHTYRPQLPGLRADGMPNRAMRRHMPRQAQQAAWRVYFAWAVAARLVPGYVWTEDETEEKAA